MRRILIPLLVSLVWAVPVQAQRPATHTTIQTTSTAASSLLVGCAFNVSTDCTGGINAGQGVFAAGLAIDGGTISTHGIVMPSGVPGTTTMALYNNAGTLTWNGAPLAVGSSVSGTIGAISVFTASNALGDSIITQTGGNTITVTGTFNATTAIQLNGTSINTAGTLTNVAYENQANTFVPSQSFSAGIGISGGSPSTHGIMIPSAVPGVTTTNLYNNANTLTWLNPASFTTVDTGQGANELYDMDQNVLTTSSPRFTTPHVNALEMEDSAGDTSLLVVMGSDVTVQRTLTLTTGDASRTVTISGNTTISQDYSTTGNPTFGTVTANLTGNASGTAATVTTAAQPAITSLGTLTILAVDNITINGNDISSTAGVDLTITPLAGQQIVLDGAIVIDAGVVTGATSITSTAFVGALTGTASAVTNATFTTTFVNNGGAGTLAWPAAGATLTVPTGGGTLGSAAFTASTAYDVAGAAAAVTPTTLGLVIGTNVQAYDADLTTWAGVTPGTGVATALAVAVGSAGAPVVLNGALGTPSSGTLTNATGLPIAGIASLGTGVGTALAVNVGSAGAFVTLNGALGTPSSGTGTNLTGIPAASILAGTFGSGNYTIPGLLTVSGGGTHTFTGGVSGAGNTLTIKNTTNDASAFASLDLLDNAGATIGQVRGNNVSSGTSGWNAPQAFVFHGARAAGVSIIASDASGDIRFYSRGTALALTLGASQAATFTGSIISSVSVALTGTTNNVGTITTGVWNAGAVTSSGGGSFTTGAFSSTLTLSGTAANIALGSNYLSGDGGDEGITIDASGNGIISGTWRLNGNLLNLSGNIMDSQGTPTIASGFGSAVTIAGNDYAFRVTVTTGSATDTGVVAFGNTWTTAPVCIATSDSGGAFPNRVNVTVTTTQVTLYDVEGAWSTGQVATVLCRGY